MSASKLTDRISLETIQEIADRFPYGKWQVAGVATGSYLAYKLARFLKMWLVDPQFSPLKDAPGPGSDDHILLGQFQKIFNSPPSSAYEEWTATSSSILITIVYIGGEHKRQRKILNPCFGPGHIRELTPIFYDKAFELRDILLRQIEEEKLESKEIDVFVWLARATLDIIGLAGKAVMARVGGRLLQEKRAAVLAAASSADGVEKESVAGKDLLSVLALSKKVKANMATDIKDSERMNDVEVIGQIYTMLIAGHETTSTTLTWLLYDLAHPKNQRVQAKLREELRSVTSNRPTADELNALPYLDAVVREALRLNSALDTTARCAGKDASIPVSKPYIDKNGVERTEISIGAGEEIIIPITVINRDKEIWGEDADELKPERWLEGNTHPRSSEIPGVFSSMLTFLGGPRSCIGYRFALLEMKVLIFALLRDISVELPDPAPEIEKKSFIITRPSIKQADGSMKSLMPLRLKAVCPE
ncbi:hypothetical protein FRC00_013747 [Tulasnella sp. 408]|nr:hypothetical protein FRC00_013747 [Tulasnella sp. 408]